MQTKFIRLLLSIQTNFFLLLFDCPFWSYWIICHFSINVCVSECAFFIRLNLYLVCQSIVVRCYNCRQFPFDVWSIVCEIQMLVFRYLRLYVCRCNRVLVGMGIVVVVVECCNTLCCFYISIVMLFSCNFLFSAAAFVVSFTFEKKRARITTTTTRRWFGWIWGRLLLQHVHAAATIAAANLVDWYFFLRTFIRMHKICMRLFFVWFSLAFHIIWLLLLMSHWHNAFSWFVISNNFFFFFFLLHFFPFR